MVDVRAGLLVAAALGAIALASCSNSPSASSGSTTTTSAAAAQTTTTVAGCTKAAISAGAMSAPSAGPVSSVTGYG